MRLIVFGSHACEKCSKLREELRQLRVIHRFVDANDEDDAIQDFCDKFGVDYLPHVVIIDDKDNVLFKDVGENISAQQLKDKFESLETNASSNSIG